MVNIVLVIFRIRHVSIFSVLWHCHVFGGCGNFTYNNCYNYTVFSWRGPSLIKVGPWFSHPIFSLPSLLFFFLFCFSLYTPLFFFCVCVADKVETNFHYYDIHNRTSFHCVSLLSIFVNKKKKKVEYEKIIKVRNSCYVRLGNFLTQLLFLLWCIISTLRIG